MIICNSSNIDIIQGNISYGNAEGITDWRLENTSTGVFNILNSTSSTPILTIIDNGNIGIGTVPITSSSKLEIIGDVNITGNYKKNNINVTNITSNFVLSTSNILSTNIENSRTQWKTNNNIIYYNTSNVGIGIGIPISSLHLYDDTINETKLTIQNNYVEPIIITPNTIGYTAVETLESNKYYRTLTFNYFPNYPEDPPNTSLLAWYRFNGDSLDYNPYATKYNLIVNDGTPTYSTGTTADSFLQGRRYMNGSISTMVNSSLQLSNRAFSISVWIRPLSSLANIFIQQGSEPTTRLMIGYGRSGINNSLIVYILSVNNVNLIAYGASSSGYLQTNLWVHIVYVVEANYNKKIYRNGVLEASNTSTTTFTEIGNLIIASGFNTTGGTADISDLRIYSNGLSATDVATLYNSYTNLVITDNYSLNFKNATTLLVNSVSKTVNGAYTLSIGHINSSMLPAGGQSDTPLTSTAITSVPIKYEYSSTTLSLPALITVAGATSSIIGTTERCISFPYTTDSSGLTGQTQYTFTTSETLICDILIVGGGGGGDQINAGGGGGGAVLHATNVTIPSNTYTIRVGKGGVQNVNGNSSEAFGAICLGGGSTSYVAWNTPNNGTAGGSGSGGSPGSWSQSITGVGGGVGVSTKGTLLNSGILYNGNIGGNGLPQVSGTGAVCGGGGGGAGSVGLNSSQTQYTTRSSWITAGKPSNGGNGIQINITETNYYWGAGGGGGGTSTHVGDGGLGGGGGGGVTGTSSTAGLAGIGGIINGINGNISGSNGGDGAPNSGSGGGGGGDGGNGGTGGSGIVIIRYRKNNSQLSSVELIRGANNDSNRDYKIGNYNGDFIVKSSINDTDNDNIKITGTTGAITNPTGTTTWTTTSDRRIKENIERASYDKCYESINKLELNRFNYINGFNTVNRDITQLGFIAQEVKEIFPKSVFENSYINDTINISDLQSIDITQINYTLYGAVKKLIEIINDDEEKIKKLESILNIDIDKMLTSNIDNTSTSNIDIDSIPIITE